MLFSPDIPICLLTSVYKKHSKKHNSSVLNELDPENKRMID